MTEMTMNEVNRQYGIPRKILREYGRLGQEENGQKPEEEILYNDRDLERLCLLMTLYEVGFNRGEAKAYMALAVQGAATGKERLEMLQKKRDGLLEEIHDREKRLNHLDYLRYGIRYET